MVQITAEIKSFDDALTAQTAGDLVLSKLQNISMNARIQEIKQMIWPGLDQLTAQLAKVDPTERASAYTELSGHYNTVSGPFHTAHDRFVAEVDYTLPGPCCLNAVNIPADFPEAETPGYNTPRKCQKCASCMACHITEEGNSREPQLG